MTTLDWTKPLEVINMDKKCPECRKGGATDNGICLARTCKAFSPKPMKSDAGKVLQARLNARLGPSKNL